MKYMSLFTLCAALALITGCGRERSNNACCPPGTVSTTHVGEGSAVEVQEATEGETRKGSEIKEPDKEDLQEAELEEVMENK